ncbi:WD domain, G-beta repeat protein (macronuclear) [Tetrahymena thermophila SB210]|uniref:WD domain, G-beta repeat protein n=1 Tax=Tetrahymena thermophila (strain SB210) TaxID=312017 RepID=I7MG93_TETTS|nr:WD domain, G-beta repeat protein [Tetrahymena thermophila SB210]EAS01252.2 WD domain, G-beta repeat protein [Tetrahymena thermophila SB210]|eukprot:XP_001021497.2 WD domain, G-beta repeat protein [Tetrahymena thermophila SB210]
MKRQFFFLQILKYPNKRYQIFKNQQQLIKIQILILQLICNKQIIIQVFSKFYSKKMDTTEAPQIIEHLNKTLTFTPYDVKWIPQTAKFVLCGQHPKATGTIQIHQLTKNELQVTRDIQHPKGIKCSTFGACLPNKADLAFGDFNGEMNIVDLETGKIYYSVKAHNTLVNAIDGIGGLDIGYGAPEIVTAGRDGCVRVWDPRQKAPVLSLEPSDKESVPDAWCVAFGNSYNNEERVLAAGYDNVTQRMVLQVLNLIEKIQL